MKTQTFVIAEEDAGTRLDKLVVQATGLGRSAVKQLFEEGRVRVAGKRVTKAAIAAPGKEVTVELDDRSKDAPAIPEPSPATPLVVLLERPDLVVVDKPAGQKTAPLRGGETGTLANALVGRYPEMAEVGFHAREPGLVHRLDNDTSGVVLAARNKGAFEALVAALKHDEIDKTYLAVCEDHELADDGVIDIPLAPHPKDEKRVLACLHPRDVEREKPRPARTTYEVLSRRNGFALVRAKAPRALRHQIRAHFSAIGCPLAGDALYGATRGLELGRHALHAASIGFAGDDVVDGFRAESGLPADLAALV